MSSTSPKSRGTALPLTAAAPAGGRGALGGRQEPGVSVAAGGGRWGGRCQGGGVKMPFILPIRQTLHEQVWAFHRPGWNVPARARHVGLRPRTGQRDLQTATFSGRKLLPEPPAAFPEACPHVTSGAPPLPRPATCVQPQGRRRPHQSWPRGASADAAARRAARMYTLGEACPPAGGGGGSGRCTPEMPAQKCRLFCLSAPFLVLLS